MRRTNLTYLVLLLGFKIEEWIGDMAKYKRTVRGGRLAATVLYTRPQAGDTKPSRAAKSRATTQARQALNLKQSRQKLEFTIAANFTGQDHHLVLTFDDEHLPENRAGVIACFRRFVRLLRAYRRKNRLPNVKYIYAIECKHGEGRFHIHVIINAASLFQSDLESYCSLWEYGTQVDVSLLYDRENTDADVLARYLTKEREDGKPVGAKSWVGSRNLEQPEETHEYVNDTEELHAPVGCIVLERKEDMNEFGSFAYIKYLYPNLEVTGNKRRR